VHNDVVQGYVGVTDQRWYEFLAARPGITEVNFWRPKDQRNFRALSGGEPFFFKTHSPQNRIVGGGIFAAFELLPVSMAWDIYREANGVSTLEEMRALITRYRDEPIRPGEDPVIGCILVRDVTFFSEPDIMVPPPGFASSIMQGKGYELASGPDVSYFTELLARVLRVEVDDSEPWHRPGPLFGDPRLIRQRLGRETRPQSVPDRHGPRGLAQQHMVVRGPQRRRVPDRNLLLPVTELRVIVLDL